MIRGREAIIRMNLTTPIRRCNAIDVNHLSFMPVAQNV